MQPVEPHREKSLGCTTIASGVLVYVHCNPITSFDPWGLETESESHDAAREAWDNGDIDYDPDLWNDFDDWWSDSDNQGSWYDRRADEGYNIFTDNYADQLRKANKEAQRELFSTSASAAINERLDILANNDVNTPEQTDEWKGKVNDYFTELSQHHTPEQMQAIAFVLEMERQQGTKSTAKYVSNNSLDSSVLQPFNADLGRNSHVNGVDIDWFTELTRVPRGPNLTQIIYPNAKKFWVWDQKRKGRELGNPVPYSDPGETRAVNLVREKAGYGSFLTPQDVPNPK